jgi:hypothetical protein
MVTGVVDVTAAVVIVKGCDEMAPAGTATVAGTAATAGLELVRLMVDPMVGAGPFIVTTFDARERPPTTFFADSITEKGVAGLTVSWAILVMP